MKKSLWVLATILILGNLVLAACKPSKSVKTETSAVAATSSIPVDAGPVLITGEFEFTNDIIIQYYVEHAVALLDMTGFVKRDKLWELPIDSQVLGYLSIDEANMKGSYRLALPARPEGLLNDVDNSGQTDAGVQIFAIGYSPNLTGGPYSEGDDPSFGWPAYLASVKADTENQDEVIGGKLVIWAPDASQQFPTGFGDDGLLFTADDPVGPVPAGYSIVDLDAKPFTLSQEGNPSLTLYEPTDVAIKDFSTLSYNKAFDSMFEIVRKEYAFNGVPGKAPDWDALYTQVSPQVKQAERNSDLGAYYLALQQFSNAFKDGHVGLNGGDYGQYALFQAAGGGLGLAARELDNGRVLVVFVLEGSPGAAAGIQKGAEIFKINNAAVQDAIALVTPLFGPYSTAEALRYDQVLFLLRTAVDAQTSVTFKNPGGKEQTVTLTAIQEFDSLLATYIFSGGDENALPVEFKILPSGVGYIKINSNYDDLNLLVRLFNRALKTFQDNTVPGVIIDMRHNSGGASLGLAGFLYDQEIPLGQLEYYSEKTGKFEPEGPRERVLPNVEQYRFDKMVLLVGNACFSACEIEAYGFSQVPGMVVMGQFPTGGVEAEVARGQFKLPGNFDLQIPTGRFTLPDGSIFLEGVGVQPGIRIPIDEASVLSEEDVVLQQAEAQILK